MDFKTKTPFDFLIKLPHTKFSIRLSILSIVLGLVLGISILIIGIDYAATDSILIASAKSSLLYSSDKVAEQVKDYLQPLNISIRTAYRMFHEGVAKPGSPEFVKFLYGLIRDNENLAGAYWCDADGNMYWLNRSRNNYIAQIVLRNQYTHVVQATETILSSDGHILSSRPTNKDIEVDYRLRPWFLRAKLHKDLTWIVYRFLEVSGQHSQYGVTSVFPIYDSQGKLQGVFGVDMLLDTISKYVQSIKLTRNSHVFVVDVYGNVLASYNLNEDALTYNDANLLDEVSDIKIPWVTYSFKLYKETQKSPLVYSYGDEDYIAAYERLSDVNSENPWFVGIATPIRDITAPLHEHVILDTVLIGSALLLGIILASIFSLSLSRPIKSLAHDSNLICQLQLESIKHLFSRIKEIAEMADAFIKMKNALYSFQRYMPIALVKKLIISNKVATVGGEEKDLTLLFTDIQDFTSLSESLHPEDLMRYLSEYFQVATKVIIDTHGTVDKYVGDGVIAFWGAPIDDPDHIQHACQAAIRVQEELQQLNLKWQREGKPSVVTRIGISSGRVVIGNVGSDDRLSYTSLGDTVNLASRLEGLNKIYGTRVMVSEFVYEKVKDQFEFRFLDRVAVRGKKQKICVYELCGTKEFRSSLGWQHYDQEFHQAYVSYEYGDWQTALARFQDLSKKYPDDRLLKVFVERCSKFVSAPPKTWEGVWVMGNNLKE